MDTKAAFEKFVIKHDPSGHCTNLLAMNEAGTNYLHPHVDIAWISWTASRAEIEIELEPLSDQYFASDIKNSFEHGREAERKATVQVLTSHGIKVKS